MRNYFVAAGLNSIGILTGGGLGRLVAHWIVDGDPGADVTGMHPARLQPYQANPEYRRTRTVESLGMVYQCHYPNRSMHTARGAKLSPLHAPPGRARARRSRTSAAGRAPTGTPARASRPTPARSRSAARRSGRRWEAEHRACREGVIVMDMSFMSKFRVQGRDAGAVLDRLSANAVNGEPGTITYTQWLNERGLLEADLTVTKLADDQFLVVATDTAHRHVESQLRRGIGDAHAFVTDVTAGLAQINVQGPRSRELLQSITTADLSNETFPFRTAREIDIGFARVLCVRITYLGELGYELYVPAEQAVHVYDRIVAAGRAVRVAARRPEGARQPADGEGLPRLRPRHRQHRRPARGRASASRSRSTSRAASSAATPCSPARRPARSPAASCSVQVLDPEPLLYHAEVVRRDGRPVGYVRAASYGHTVGGAVGLAMVEGDGEPITPAWLADATWTVEINGAEHPAVTSLRPLYDPTNDRIKQ